jgi:hypothetical protein
MILSVIVFYIIPAILSLFVIIHNEDEVTIGDLIIIILLSLLPIVNLFGGYVGGLIMFCQSEQVNNFLNKRIK